MIAIISGIIAYANPQIMDEVKEVDECIEKFKPLIPDTFVLERRQSYDDWKLYDGFGIFGDGSKFVNEDEYVVEAPEITKWKDGTDFYEPRIIKYRQGENIRENTNFYYAESDSYSSDSTELVYNKRIIDKEGNIIGNDTFRIVITLTPIENTLQELGVYTESGYILYDMELQFFEIAEYIITECNWVEIK